MADIKDRAREYIAKHSEYSEVFGQFFVAVDTLTAMVEFAEQETKELQAQIEKMKNCKNCKKLKKEKDGLLICTVGSFYTNTFGKNCDKWEIKEK